jgi:hypothetical protein
VILIENVANFGKFANHLLEPKFEGLMDDYEVHFIGANIAIFALEREEFW